MGFNFVPGAFTNEIGIPSENSALKSLIESIEAAQHLLANLPKVQ